MTIDWDKPVQTRGGLDVYIYTIKGRHPTHGVYGEYFKDIWHMARWRVDGTVDAIGTHCRDLVNVPQQHTVWVNIYRYGDAIQVRSHVNRTEADHSSTEARIACIRVPFTEGEGLE